MDRPQHTARNPDWPVVTRSGTRIARWRNLVGKRVGTRIYVHRRCASLVIPANILRDSKDILRRRHPRHRYACLMYDLSTGAVRFDEAPDFDRAREPQVGRHVTVFRDGTTRVGESDAIWHHKWEFVLDSYDGFDVEASRQWSRTWAARLPEQASGSSRVWKGQLRRARLG